MQSHGYTTVREEGKGEIEKMCNLSEGVMKRNMTEGLQKGIEKGILIGEERMREKATKEKLTIFSKLVQELNMTPSEQNIYVKSL